LDTYFHQLRGGFLSEPLHFSAALKIPMLSENLEWFELGLFCPVQNGDFHPF
jgi:hypothetical protein